MAGLSVPDVGRDLLEVVRRMVDRPEAVELSTRREGDEVTFGLRLAPEDLGKVIGRQGRTARALRALLEVRGERDRRRYELEILED